MGLRTSLSLSKTRVTVLKSAEKMLPLVNRVKGVSKIQGPFGPLVKEG